MRTLDNTTIEEPSFDPSTEYAFAFIYGPQETEEDEYDDLSEDNETCTDEDPCEYCSMENR